MNFAALVSFNRVAAHGGFSQAGRATGQAKATLARHVRELEDELGVRLVERGARALRLTEQGRVLRLRTEGPLSEVEAAAKDISAGSELPQGRLRVSAPVMFAHLAVDRIAAEFAMRHPAIELELTADDRNVDMVAEGYDVVIRIDPRPDPRLVGRCFLRDRLLVVARPSLPRPTSHRDAATELAAPAVVCSSDPDNRPWRLLDGEKATTIRPQPVLRVSTQLMVLGAVRAGAGAGRLPASLVMDDLSKGRLACWGVLEGNTIELWALHTSSRLISPKVESFVDFLSSAFTTT